MLNKKRVESKVEKDVQENPQKKLKSEQISSSNTVPISKNESDDEPPLFSFQTKGKSQSSKVIVNSSTETTQKIEKINSDKKPSKFSDLGLSKWILDTLQEMGMKEPTPIQINSILPILRGVDFIGSAPTGSGKTAAFALPILTKLSEDPFAPFALVLTPTRELAFQIGEQFTALGAPIKARVEVLVGGRDMIKQAISLDKMPHIIVATPGRLLDHLNSNSTFKLNRIKYLVLDEADRLVTNDGLSNTIREILTHLSERRQTLLFSATMSIDDEHIQFLNLKNTEKYFQGQTFDTVETLTQEYLFIPSKVKHCYLTYLIRLEEELDEKRNQEKEENDDIGLKLANTKSTVIVFTSTCFSAQLIKDTFKELGIKSVTLHSELTQHMRITSLQQFKSGKVKVLVATDVANRGLDIPSVELVINFDVPKSVEDYVHRVGRTARAGRGGRAITLITPNDIDYVHLIEENIGKKMTEYSAKEEDILRHLNETTVAKARATLKLQEASFGEKKKKYKQKEVNGENNQKKQKTNVKLN